MSKKILTIFLSLFLLSFVFIPFNVNAGTNVTNSNESILFGTLPKCFASDSKEECTVCDVIEMLVGLARFILKFVGVLALLLFVFGGFKLIISAGNEEAVKKAKGILTGALIGILIVLVAWQMVWLTVATLKGGKEGKNIFEVANNKYKYDWSDWRAACGESSTNDTGDKKTPEIIPPAKTQGTRGYREDCTKIEDCKTGLGLTCEKKFGEQKFICTKLNSLKYGDSCIRLETNSECKISDNLVCSGATKKCDWKGKK